jgi:hypothetical protein
MPASSGPRSVRAGWGASPNTAARYRPRSGVTSVSATTKTPSSSQAAFVVDIGGTIAES